MSFVSRISTHDERIVMIARLHWIYPLIGALWFAFALGIGFILDTLMWVYIGRDMVFQNISFFGLIPEFSIQSPFTWLFGAGGGVFFVSLLLRYMSTEIGLTSKRVIYKTGLFMVEVEEVDLEEIKAERVHHGIFGYVLGYGRINIDCRFVSDVHLPAIRKPYRLVKAINIMRERLRAGQPSEKVP